MRRWLIIIGLLLFVLLGVVPVSAHANLVAADPPPNAVLPQTPTQITLTFSEPLEPEFSKILLRDQNGNIMDFLPSQVDPTNPLKMTLNFGGVPDGLYTVVWRALSVADGHATLGSYPFIVGSSTVGFGATTTDTSEVLGVGAGLIRWANVLSLAIGAGGLGFFLFVWIPAVSEKQPAVESWMTQLIWIGWVLIGVTGFLLVVLQYSVATGEPLLGNIIPESLNSLVADTRFGHLWLARMALWAGLGGALWFARTDRWFYWIALLIAGWILAINSVFSHANAALDQTAAVATDFLHLTAMALWVGGLFQFLIVILRVRRNPQTSPAILSSVVGYFSNFARVAVASLVITGLYLAWLDVGSLDGLFNTFYGRILIVKMLLLVPVLGIAFVNLVYTHRGLSRGEVIWTGRLRKLVTAEIILTTGMLLAVGAMTSSYPSRTVLDLRAANPPQPQPNPIDESLDVNDLHVELTISPGWVGNNNFTLLVSSGPNGIPVNDASLIRIKFSSQTQNLGESELRPTRVDDGTYAISGANLSIPGDWRVRVTIQRPNQYDALVDFKPNVPDTPEFPTPVLPPSPDTPLPNRVLALVLAGMLALIVGGYFLGENRSKILRASTLLAIGLLVVGGLLLMSAMQGVPATVSAASTPSSYQPASPDTPIRLEVASNEALPYIITADGKLLQPGDDNQWHVLPLDAQIRDVYIDVGDKIWAATDSGLYEYADNYWTQKSGLVSSRVVMTHGYLFALGQGSITRVAAGGIEGDEVRELNVPVADQSATEFVMLGNHSHILQLGDQLYHTFDLGLSWEPVTSAQPIDAISIDLDGNLLATDDKGLLTWNYVGTLWSSAAPLPMGDAHAILRTFNQHLYAIASGGLYLQVGSMWQPINLPDSQDAVLTSLEFQYPTTLWVLDSQGSRVWSSTDANNWTMTKIAVS